MLCRDAQETTPNKLGIIRRTATQGSRHVQFVKLITDEAQSLVNAIDHDYGCDDRSDNERVLDLRPQLLWPNRSVGNAMAKFQTAEMTRHMSAKDIGEVVTTQKLQLDRARAKGDQLAREAEVEL